MFPKRTEVRTEVFLGICIFFCACLFLPSNAHAQKKMMKKNIASEDIKFKDDAVKSNTTAPKSVEQLKFVDTDGKTIAIKDFRGEKNVVIVFTEGFYKKLCPFCKTQTSRLIANYDKFKELDTEILVVYPGDTKHLAEFIDAAKTIDKEQVDAVPFPIVLDQDFEATEFFKIRSKQAFPSTYVINKRGEVCLAYVGANMSADRPSVKALLKRVTQENKN